jgi:uncharacterized spore protein YtfJ
MATLEIHQNEEHEEHEEAATRAQLHPLFERFAGRLGESARAAAVFGEPVEHDGLTIIPVARARWGLGGGSQRSERAGAGIGGGGGATVSPIGYIEMGGGSARFKPVFDLKVIASFGLTAVALLLFALTRRRN